MKKLVSILLVAAMAVSLAACGGGPTRRDAIAAAASATGMLAIRSAARAASRLEGAAAAFMSKLSR